MGFDGWRVGGMGTVIVTATGPAPVPVLSVDLDRDGQPAWWFPREDGRTRALYRIGPIRRAGAMRVTVAAVDVRGCPAELAVPVTIAP